MGLVGRGLINGQAGSQKGPGWWMELMGQGLINGWAGSRAETWLVDGARGVGPTQWAGS